MEVNKLIILTALSGAGKSVITETIKSELAKANITIASPKSHVSILERFPRGAIIENQNNLDFKQYKFKQQVAKEENRDLLDKVVNFEIAKTKIENKEVLVTKEVKEDKTTLKYFPFTTDILDNYSESKPIEISPHKIARDQLLNGEDMYEFSSPTEFYKKVEGGKYLTEIVNAGARRCYDEPGISEALKKGFVFLEFGAPTINTALEKMGQFSPEVINFGPTNREMAQALMGIREDTLDSINSRVIENEKFESDLYKDLVVNGGSENVSNLAKEYQKARRAASTLSQNSQFPKPKLYTLSSPHKINIGKNNEDPDKGQVFRYKKNPDGGFEKEILDSSLPDYETLGIKRIMQLIIESSREQTEAGAKINYLTNREKEVKSKIKILKEEAEKNAYYRSTDWRNLGYESNYKLALLERGGEILGDDIRRDAIAQVIRWDRTRRNSQSMDEFKSQISGKALREIVLDECIDMKYKLQLGEAIKQIIEKREKETVKVEIKRSVPLR